jgi:hypothetical protein
MHTSKYNCTQTFFQSDKGEKAQVHEKINQKVNQKIDIYDEIEIDK